MPRAPHRVTKAERLLLARVGDLARGRKPGFEVGDLTAKPLDLKFTALTPDNADVRAAIEAELDDYLRRTMAPGSTAPISQINEAISTAAGEDDHTLFETEDVTSTANELIVKGEITWPA